MYTASGRHGALHGAAVVLCGFGIGFYVASVYCTTLSVDVGTDGTPSTVAADSDSRPGPERWSDTPPGHQPQSTSDRLIIVCTMSYEHIFRRPNLARTAAQLVGGGRVLWVVIEDTHSLRKKASTAAHYQWIINDTRRFVHSLGVDAMYIAEDSPFPASAPRSPKIETHQRNLGLTYAYRVVEDGTVAVRHGVQPCPLAGAAGAAVRQATRDGKLPITAAEAELLFKCPVVYIADDDNVYMPSLWPALRRVMRVALFPTGNMGYDGIEGPLVAPAQDDPPGSLRGRLTGFNVWHGSDPVSPRGWDKVGAARKFPGDMAGLAFNAVMQPKFTGPRYGFHETDIVEQTGVRSVAQIEGTMAVMAHHVHNEKTKGRLCYPIDWNYTSPTSLWFNVAKSTTHSGRVEACGGCAPQPAQADFRGCKGFTRPR
mmetsp:Transcript_3610/g.8959  ORF Transcript_3610/g.8959 Transcript_3610/m.8959 type:complete len:427 (-) Transcript_3610:102-1382(-)